MSMSPSGSLFADLPTELSEELFETILSLPGIRIERIISSGQATPDGEWYDQPQGEWVFLAAGSAGLLLQGELEPRRLLPGDYLFLPPHCRHRVAWTDPEQLTIWLAVHCICSKN